MTETVNHPSHYQLTNGIEAFDVMQGVMSEEEFDGYTLGNVLKYILRYKQKNGVEDLRKARFYLDMLIERVDK